MKGSNGKNRQRASYECVDVDYEDIEDFSALASMAFLFASDAAAHATDRSLHYHGGYGFSEEYEVIWYHAAARLLRTAPVSAEMVLNFVAEHDLGLPRSY